MNLKTSLFSVFCIFIGLTTSACGSVYVVAPDGSDDNPGTLKSPFKTVQKCADAAQPGTTCLLREGIYRETVKPKISGTSTEPITFQAYKNESATISGTNPVENWNRHHDSIFRTNVTLPVDGYSDTGFLANQVFVNGKMMPEARWPNNKYLDPMLPTLAECCLQSEVGTDAIIENSEIPNLGEEWKGATVWTNEWYVTRTGTVTGGTPGKLTAKMTAPWERGGYYFYLIGRLGLLDTENEWFYHGADQTLYLWAPGGLSPKEVEVKQRNFAFDLSDQSYITLKNLELFANTITTSDKSQGIVIDGIKAKYVSHHITLPPLPESEQAPGSDSALIVASHAHDTGIQLRGRGHTLKNSIVEWSSGNGVLLEGTNHTVTNNVIANSNYMVSQAAPVRINGNDHKITHNTIKRTSAAGIQVDWHTSGFEVNNVEIAYNDISHFGLRSTDLGAIGVCCRVNLEGGSIHHNWIRDTKAFSNAWGTRGIYLDLESFNSIIHHNVVWNLIWGKDNFNYVAGSPRGYNRVFNNTFLGSVQMDSSIEAINNIFADSENVSAGKQSNNLFMNTDPLFARPPTEESKSIPDFSLKPDSPAVDAGIVIPGITDDFAGDAPDIGAYERGKPVWKSGSDIEYTIEGEGRYR
ncbi:right-handed parallel beta-helix repeat-containing protein [Pleurocapsa sp. FMAR1]|uniref:right-handed parallel beta-helix repeat-containing protein n=1 Tax=Pleurocapsa sp. FMAR1 TaxID=3040204 RepID=UPI0029C707F5|nr:right-handed parallel beta-helix repeat-containing protein [Pleurocapsa sp. FMAR1]